jgi:MscS family membrane protein
MPATRFLIAILLSAAEPAPGEQPKLVEAADHIAQRWPWLGQEVIAGNQLWQILGLVIVVALSLVAARAMSSVLSAMSRRFAAIQRPLLSAAATACASSAGYLVAALGLKAGMEFVIVPRYEEWVARSTSMLVAVAIGLVLYRLVDVVDAWVFRINEKNPSRLDDMLTTLLRASLRAAIFVLVIVQIVTLWSDKPAASVIAGLGVGGLAIGLAAQDSIKNLFGSLMIFSDRPFELGDEIIVDAFRGSVEQVGLRSTRIRTADGYLITMPNSDLATKSVVNVSKRRSIVRNLNLPLSYELSPERVERAAAIVKEILADRKELPPLAPANVWITDLTPTAITLNVSYQFMPPVASSSLEFNQQVNLEILRRFRAENIRLAYPTQTIDLRPREADGERSTANDRPAADQGAPPPAQPPGDKAD